MADEDGDNDELPVPCPICSTKDCQDHLLGCFDVTFADQGEGNYGVGLTSGSLFDVGEIGDVLDLARLAWVRSVRATGKPAPPQWISEAPGLSAYFDALGDSGGFDVSDHEDDADAANELAGYTDYHSTVAREFIEEALIACGWDGEKTHDYDDVFLASSSYSLWWDADPKERAKAVQALLTGILAEAASTPPRPRSQALSCQESPRSVPDASVTPEGPTRAALGGDDDRPPCPICTAKDCTDHLLACFDVTFADQGEGKFGAGIVNGALYRVGEIAEALDFARLTWVCSVQMMDGAPPVCPEWISDTPGLSAYFDNLGDSGGYVAALEQPDEQKAADELPGCTDLHSVRVREFLEELLSACGWAGTTTTEDFDRPGQSTTYISWWDAEPQKRVEAVRTLLARTLEEVRSAISAPTPKPAPTKSACPVCKRPDSECQDHLLAFHLFPSAGTGLEAGFLMEVEEIEAVLAAVRTAWVRSVRDKEPPVPVPPTWIWEDRALRDYFYQLGPFHELQLADSETDHEVAEQLRDLPWDHSELVRDFLAALLPECGWEELTSEVPSERDEDTGIECLGSASWWSADPRRVAAKLRVKLVTALAKADASGKA